MALDARRRSSIYQKLIPILGEDDANTLMSEFPALEADELVTKQFLRAEMAELRTDVADLRTELRTDLSGLRAELAGLRTEFRAELHQAVHGQTLRLLAVVGTATSILGVLGVFT